MAKSPGPLRPPASGSQCRTQALQLPVTEQGRGKGSIRPVPRMNSSPEGPWRISWPSPTGEANRVSGAPGHQHTGSRPGTRARSTASNLASPFSGSQMGRESYPSLLEVPPSLQASVSPPSWGIETPTSQPAGRALSMATRSTYMSSRDGGFSFAEGWPVLYS